MLLAFSFDSLPYSLSWLCTYEYSPKPYCPSTPFTKVHIHGSKCPLDISQTSQIPLFLSGWIPLQHTGSHKLQTHTHFYHLVSQLLLLYLHAMGQKDFSKPQVQWFLITSTMYPILLPQGCLKFGEHFRQLAMLCFCTEWPLSIHWCLLIPSDPAQTLPIHEILLPSLSNKWAWPLPH